MDDPHLFMVDCMPNDCRHDSIACDTHPTHHRCIPWNHGCHTLFVIPRSVYNLSRREKKSKINILWLCAIGVAVQFGWEFALLVGNIRSTGVELPQQIRTLVVNSLVETNLGMPLMYLIHKFLKSRYTEDLKNV